MNPEKNLTNYSSDRGLVVPRLRGVLLVAPLPARSGSEPGSTQLLRHPSEG